MPETSAHPSLAQSVLTGPDWGFGLYVHWPYCARICPYCDFNVYAARTPDTAPLMAAILTDIADHGAILPGHPPLGSVFLGGGTPSRLAPRDLAAVIETAARTFGLTPDAEITLEANPEDVLSGDLAGWVAAGINRLSLGVQSLDDGALAFLGRGHSADGARRAVAMALDLPGLRSVSVDMIYARPGQTLADWERELTAALALGAPHLSLYELTIEARTAFGKRAARGDLVPLEEEAQARLYELTQGLAAAAGLPAYEVSNHARGPAHASRHNHVYWASGDWIGVGPGAHGRLTLPSGRHATEAVRNPAAYQSQVRQTGRGWPDTPVLTPGEIARELLAMGLRPAEGLDLARLEAVRGRAVDAGRLARLRADGLIGPCPARLALTPAGWLLADAIARQLAE